MNMLKHLLAFLVCIPFLAHARKVLEEPESPGPWFTGPLLTSSGHVIPLGHANFEPYVYWTDIQGSYDNHWHYFRTPPSFKQVLSQTALQFGILPATEIDILPQFLYNNSGGEHKWRVADQPIAIAFQLLMDQPDTWWPAIKLRLGAIIPLGKYDRLDVNKGAVDVGGYGNWAPTLSLVTVKVYHFGGHHYLAWRMGYNFTFTTPIHIHGVSIWGGSLSTPQTAPPIPAASLFPAAVLTPTLDPTQIRGTIYPGCVFTVQQGFEYSFTRNLAFALDLQYIHANRTRFSGKNRGIPMSAPSAEQFSVAPALEYNFNANVGVIAGPWFTVAGRNNNQTNAFISWVFAINIYH